jgi:hypothetical protein
MRIATFAVAKSEAYYAQLSRSERRRCGAKGDKERRRDLKKEAVGTFLGKNSFGGAYILWMSKIGQSCPGWLHSPLIERADHAKNGSKSRDDPVCPPVSMRFHLL